MNEEYWTPKTELGQKVMSGEIKSIDEIFKKGEKIKEPEIVDKLLPGLKSEIILVGGTPGKGGGIRRTPTKRTARMHKSGRRFSITALSVVGNEDGYVGIGQAKSTNHRQAIQKASTQAKLNIIPVKRGCGSWECGCGEKHSIPVKVSGKHGSVSVTLIPAPKGIGLCVSDEVKKIMKLAGIKDMWSKSFGNTHARINFSLAVLDAFKALNRMHMPKSSDNTEEIPEEETEKKTTTKVDDKRKKTTDKADTKKEKESDDTTKKSTKETKKDDTKKAAKKKEKE